MGFGVDPGSSPPVKDVFGGIAPLALSTACRFGGVGPADLLGFGDAMSDDAGSAFLPEERLRCWGEI